MSDTRKILDNLLSGEISIEEAEKRIRTLALDRVGSIAQIDVDRGNRSGIPEVVFADSKDIVDIIDIVKGMLEKTEVVLVTRMTSEKLVSLKENMSRYQIEVMGRHPILSVLISTGNWISSKKEGRIAIVTAGTSDIPYANESEALARLMGVDVISFYDVGVSGIHRLIEPLKEIIAKDVDAVIVFAGMEGALPTVIAALIDIPVIGVPVPTGYGYGGKGETALASMLQSCSPGLAVVNIGNGLGAASVATLIAKRAVRMNK
ncbi:MAG: nickel pincer cofactor biosynthesis protein LarB [Candidatus Thorarchaeota archaeon]|nr:nickel pincer cofactor biosynthesis protein LarB [Candidatus Thorarchaeota archaeon]